MDGGAFGGVVENFGLAVAVEAALDVDAECFGLAVAMEVAWEAVVRGCFGAGEEEWTVV